MKPAIKFGDILTFTEEWWENSGKKKPAKPVLFVATGKIIEQMKDDYVICVVEENKRYVYSYHSSFLKKVAKEIKNV